MLTAFKAIDDYLTFYCNTCDPGTGNAVDADSAPTYRIYEDETGTPNASFDTQVKEIFANLDKTIKANGGSGLADMVNMTVFITDTRLGDHFTELRKAMFKGCYPASALITVAGLAQQGLLIEIQGIAVVGGK